MSLGPLGPFPRTLAEAKSIADLLADNIESIEAMLPDLDADDLGEAERLLDDLRDSYDTYFSLSIGVEP